MSEIFVSCARSAKACAKKLAAAERCRGGSLWREEDPQAQLRADG